MSVKPIKPSEVAKVKKDLFPDEVISSFNELIAEHYVNGRSCVKQKDVIARMVSKGLSQEDIHNNCWLDVEPIYEKAGWKVEYDKPGFNESYDATFTFITKTWAD